MIDTADIIAILIFIIILIALFISDCGTINRNEDFNVGKVECADSYCEDTTLMSTHNMNGNLLLDSYRYISVNDFNVMVQSLREIVVATIKKQVSVCKDMGGSGDDKTIISQMTFNCINDLESVQDEVIDEIAKYVAKFIKKLYGFNINPLLVVMDFKNDYDILEELIYPLVFTGKYTIQGMQYFTENMLRYTVYTDQELVNALYTTLIRRGIDVLPINDEHL